MITCFLCIALSLIADYIIANGLHSVKTAGGVSGYKKEPYISKAPIIRVREAAEVRLTRGMYER